MAEVTSAEESGGHDVALRIVLGLGLGAIPLVLILLIYMSRHNSADDLVDQLPSESAREQLLKRGSRLVPQLVRRVYDKIKFDERDIAIIGIVVGMGYQDQLPIPARRAFFASLLDKPDAESRLVGIRGTSTIGPPFPVRKLADLLEDERTAEVHGGPGLPKAQRKRIPQRAGVIANEAADMLGSLLAVVFTDSSGRVITPETPTAQLIPEARAARIKHIRDALEKKLGGGPRPSGTVAPREQ